MKDPNSVLVLQTANLGVLAFITGIGYQGLERDRDFSVFNHPAAIAERLFVDRPQLLITGIISGDSNDLPRFVNESRKKNPQLVIICFSSFEDNPGDFDRVINKNYEDCWELVVQAINDFESGMLRRSVLTVA